MDYSEVYRKLRLFYPGGLETRKVLKNLEHLQWLSPDEYANDRLTEVKRLVKYAYEHVPYYHNRYKGLDIHPEDIKSLEDFQSLPYLTREDIKNHLPELVVIDFPKRIQKNWTGGSTGEPMQFYVEDSFWSWYNALEIRGRAWHGVREGEKMAWVWGAQRDMYNWNWGAKLRARLMQHRYLNAFSLTDEKMKSFAEMLVKWKPAIIMAYPSALSIFSEYIREHKIAGINPKVIETTAEKLTDPYRRLIEEVFQCKVIDRYGSRELGTIAFPCEIGGLHVCESLYLEIVAGDRVVPQGEAGEVVVTSFPQRAMPLIRYKNNDVSVYKTSPCECGRGLPVLREVIGRNNDFIVTADGQYIHYGYFIFVFSQNPEILQYQIYQPDNRHLDVYLVCRQPVDVAWLNNVRDELRSHVGAGMDISLQLVNNIPLTREGKHRFIVSDVKHQLF